MNDLQISIEDVWAAQKTIGEVARRTPINLALGRELRSKNVHVKLENLQMTGSFKIRGSLNKITNLSEDEKKQGVIAASAGNHAQGVALSCQLKGVNAKIVMPEGAPLIKIAATQSYGAEVVLHGRIFDDAYKKAQELAQEENRVFVHPYQDKHVIAGQGTIGVEIMEAIPDLEHIVVPIGGGGLISGISYVVKHLNPKCKIHGVVSNQAPGMLQMKNGIPVELPPVISTIADGIAVKHPSPMMFETYIDKYVDDIVAVSDEELARAIVYGMEMEKTVLEGSGAAGLAAVLSGKLKFKGPSCVVLCGGNIDLNTMSSVIDTGLRKAGRLARISVIVDDLPGHLAMITRDFADLHANVLDVLHDRVSPELSLRQTRIDVLLETMSQDHIDQIKDRLRQRNINIIER